MRDEKQIKALLEGMYRHAPLIKDDYQRFGFDNFMSALEYCLNDNQIVNTQIEAAARDKGLKVCYVPIGDKVVELKE